jgi:hypothetical protein
MPYAVNYQMFGRDNRVVTKVKEFKSEKAMLSFLTKLEARNDFYRVVAYAGK